MLVAVRWITTCWCGFPAGRYPREKQDVEKGLKKSSSTPNIK